MEAALELQHVTKKFKNKLIIDNLSIFISLNQVTAIVGKNGSGKSTLLKMISGLIKPDTGQILFPNEAPIRIGYVPETTPFTIPFTLLEYLTHMGKIRGLPKQRLKNRIHTLLKIFDMEAARDVRIVHFSKGMKQKVAIMQAMLEETDLLIMDEPLSGLDQKAQVDLESLLISLKAQNIGIILTCHEMKLLEKVVDQVLVIQDKKVIQTRSQQLSNEPINRVVFELPNIVSDEPFKSIIISDKKRADGQRIVELHLRQDQTNKIVKELLNQGASIKLLEPLHLKDQAFLGLFKGEEKLDA